MTARSISRAAAGAAALAITGTLAACGGSAATGGSTPTGTPSATTSSGHAGRYAGRRFRPAVSGVISSVSGRSMQVSATSGSTSKVTWTSSTSIADQVPATESVVGRGACVAIRPAGFGDRRGTAGPSSPPASSSHPARVLNGPVTAGTVTALPALSCSSNGTVAGGFGFGLAGTVAATKRGSFTVRTVAHARPAHSASPTATPARSRAALPRTLTVYTTASTTYLRQRVGSDADVQAGLCVVADGKTSGSTLAARALTISQSVNGACSSGLGGTGSEGGPSA